MIIVLCLLLFPASAQEVALNQLAPPPIDRSQDETQQSLKSALRQLEETYGVRFNYAAKLVTDKYVTPKRVTTQSLDHSLNDLLTPLGLKYEMLSKELIFITKDQNNKLKKLDRQKVNDKQEDTRAKPSGSLSQVSPRPNRFVISAYLEKTITGQVTDVSDNTSLPGVNVLVKGTTIGTVTDIDGNYSLSVPDDVETLLFSSIGYETKEVNIGNQNVVNVALTLSVQELSEVVVIGFGEREKKDLTGSISTVQAEDIEKIALPSPQFALQGKATGVRVVNTSGNPNEAPQIFVRGIGTWNGDAQPLYVIDGQIIEPPRAGNEDVIGGAGLNTPPNLFNLINSNDIESISVLKDASAAAVYGSRAANGVVLITTKKGKTGAPTVEVNTRTGFQSIPTFDMLNTEQFVQLSREMYQNSTNPDVNIEEDLYGRNEPNDAIRLTNFNPQFDPESPYYISDRTTYDWQDELTTKNALDQAYDVKVSGANDRLDYYVSAGLFDQKGVIYNNDIRRYTGAINLNVNVTDWLKTGINFKYTSQSSNLNSTVLQDMADVSPWQPLRDPNNQYGYAPVIDPYRFGDTWQAIKIYGQGSNNNYLALTDINTSVFDINRSLGQFYAQVEPFEGLTLRGSLNLDYTQQDRFGLNVFTKANIFRTTGIDPRLESPSAPNSLADMEHRINNIFNFQSDFTATYKRIFDNKHNVNLTAAVQDQRHRRETVNLSTENLTNLTDDPRLNGYGSDLANNNSFYSWNQRFWFGMVGRLSYNYDSRYYLDVSYRRDASNGFDDDYRWGNFYSASGAWRISSEPFFNVPFVDDLKLRGGWGQAGNDQAAVGAYAFLSRVNGGASSYRWGSGNGNPIGNLSLGATVADFPNPALSWEVATTTYAGFDALLLNNKLNVTFEWYDRITSGILQSVNLPYSVGTNNPLFNIGELRNRGIDLLVGYNDRVGEFSYGISGNISFLHNEVTKLYLGQPLSTEFGRVEEGRSIGHLWGYQLGGIFQSQQEIDQFFSEYEDANVGNTDFVEPGDMYFQDVQGNPTEEEPFYSKTPDGVINSFDQTEIGNTIPGYTYGLNLNVGWKGLDLTVSFYGEGDVEKYNDVRRRFEGMSGAGTNYFASTLNRWTPQNTNTDMPRAVIGDPAGNNRFSTRWVESAAFFRLNNWQLGYTLPASVLDALNNTVKSLRIYVGGQNNLYLYSWSGIDPVNDEFPLPRAINAGLNIRF
uniref:TonB-dependent receptor n=1 Tax=Roseihalotalea indica TaxID=2867963 RepID=A0AA49GNN4_9BACT|nr:TonB-dependent receptor [Tunicatimonas sp. TK19036]